MVLTRTQHTRARTPVAAQFRGAHTQPSIPTRCASLLRASLSCQSFSFCSSPKKNVFLGRLGKSFEKEKEETMKRKKRGISAVAKVQGLREHYHPSSPHSIFLSACHVPARGAEAQCHPLETRHPGKEGNLERNIRGRKCQGCCCPAKRIREADMAVRSKLFCTRKKMRPGATGGTLP